MAALQSLESAGLIGWPNAEASVPVRTGRGAKERRFEFFNPAAVCRALARPAALLTGAGGFVLSTIGATAQLLFLIGFRADATPGAGANWVAAGLVALTLVLHEFAHGAVLARCGGAPKAMGAMLVCFVPVLFCDIADSLRLGRREQVKVALAGVALQCQVGAALLPAASLGPGAMATIRLYTTVNLVVAAVNLVPLVPLDGYLALRSALGVPNLRTLALAAWREAVANLFLRTRRSAAHLHRGQPAWMVAFGGACAAAPLLFLVVWSSRLAALLHDQAPETRSAVGIVAIAVTVGAAVIRMRKARRERVALS
jgi:putative peptide zinc metalloprotease protein